MFWRYIEHGHPAARGRETPASTSDAIRELYQHNDALVGARDGRSCRKATC